MSPERVDVILTPDIWPIVERYFQADILYREQHDRYEELVAHFVGEFGVPRHQVRLDQAQLSGLLDFSRLAEIRDSYLLPLKELCHVFFRRANSTDFLDRLVNDIFHEISILKEEHYNVLTYSPTETKELSPPEQEEMRAIFDEVHEMFPIKVHRLLHLFDRARSRLEGILSKYADNAVLVRSLFLNRKGFVAKVYEGGLEEFYRLIYGENQIFAGYKTAGDSFYHSGFYERASQCFVAGEKYLATFSDEEKSQRLDPSWEECAEHFKRYIRNCRDRVAGAEEI